MADTESTGSSGRTWLMGLLLGFGVFLLYFRCGEFAFVHYDDPDYVTGNPNVQRGLTLEGVRWAWTTFDASNWHPLTWLSLQLDATLFGVSARGFHLTNVLLHAGTAVLLFAALLRLTRSSWPSLAVSLLFAVHPLRVESVAWVSERKDVLSLIFGTASLWCYAYYVERPSWRRGGLVFVMFAMSLLAKPMLVTFPCVLLLLDYWPLNRFHRDSWGRLVLEKLPLVALTISSAVVTVLAQSAGKAIWSETRFPAEMRLANAALATTVYLRQTFLPFDLGAFYPHSKAHLGESRVWEALGLLSLVTGLALWAWRRAPWFATGWLWFLGALVPVIGIFMQQGKQGHADRYTYWPHIGLWIAVVWGIFSLSKSWQLPRPIVRLALVTVVLFLSWRTYQQTEIWRDSEGLWKHTLAVTGPNAHAETAYGSELDLRGDKAGALARFRKAVAIDPLDEVSNTNLGAQLAEMGLLGEAETVYRNLLKTETKSRKAHTGLGMVLLGQGRSSEARGAFEQALQIEPQHALTHYNLGLLLSDPAEIKERQRHLEAAVHSEPHVAKYHSALAEALEWQELDQQAESEFRKAIHLNPNDAWSIEQLSLLLERHNHASEALAVLQEGISKQPMNARLYLALGLVFDSLGKSPAAAAAYSRSRDLDPQAPMAGARMAGQWAVHPDVRLRRPQRAAAIARQLIGVYPQDPDGFEILAASRAAQGRFDEALQHVETALSLAQNRTDIIRRLENQRQAYRERRPWTN